MTSFDTIHVSRVLSPDEATAMIGQDVPPAEPTATGPTVAVDADSGEAVYAYLPLGDVSELRRAILGIEYGGSKGQIRADGRRNSSRTFGYSPRRPVYRREGCSSTSTANQHPDQHRVVASFADRCADVLAEIDPRLPDTGRAAVSAVEPEWRMGESKLWTSGVINESATLPWHRDGFNFPAWSAMPVLRRGMTGGHLSIAEYGATLPCRDGWGVFFPGYQLLHGVTPMSLRRKDGYRYSIVYYALRGMKDCFTAAAETAYARRRRTEREQDMAARLAAGEAVANNLPAGRTGKAGRMVGGRQVQHGKEPVRDPRLSKKKGFRLMGGRGQGELNGPDESNAR